MSPSSARRSVTIAQLLTPLTAGLHAQHDPRPMTVVDLINLPSLSDPRLSPDGSQALYVRSDADWQQNKTVAHVWRVQVDGSRPVQLTNGQRGERGPRWSPDSEYLIYSSGAKEASEIEIRNIDGDIIPLTDNEVFDGAPAWGPLDQ